MLWLMRNITGQYSRKGREQENKKQNLMGDSSSGRWATSLLIPFDDCEAISIKRAAKRSKSTMSRKALKQIIHMGQKGRKQQES